MRSASFDCSLAFPPDPVWVRAARETVRTLLAAVQRADLLDTALLLTSETVTNAVNACRNSECTSPVTVHAEYLDRSPGTLRVLVRDQAAGAPVSRTPGPDEESGRGLMLIATGADAWGVCGHGPGPGKATWFELGVRAATDGRTAAPPEPAPAAGQCASPAGSSSAR